MAFEATKREWGELYAFFRLLADGHVYSGTPDVKKNVAQCLPVAMVQRVEHDGIRRYIVERMRYAYRERISTSGFHVKTLQLWRT